MLQHLQLHRNKNNKMNLVISPQDRAIYVGKHVFPFFFFTENIRFLFVLQRQPDSFRQKEKQKSKMKKYVRKRTWAYEKYRGNTIYFSRWYYINAGFIECIFVPFLLQKRVEYCIELTEPRAIWFAYRYKIYHKTQSEIIAVSPCIRNKHIRKMYLI